MTARVFLLSPARLDGERAQLLFREAAAFPLARALRSPRGVPLGEVFRFLSGLYFRGKLAYGERFARPPTGQPGVLVMTANRGLVAAGSHVTLDDLAGFRATDIHDGEASFVDPLERDATSLERSIGPGGDVVLLGSIATAKYTQVLSRVFGERLLFPIDFVGRGDMSRGGLLLRATDAGVELPYVPVGSVPVRGTRPAKLAPRRTVIAAPAAKKKPLPGSPGGAGANEHGAGGRRRRG
jgi:hypothetical protein